MEKVIRIGIIGMGASGTTAAVHLLHELKRTKTESRFEILGFEHKYEVGRGLAYSTPHAFHILNMTARTMSLFPDEPLDFCEWLQSSKNPPPELEYVPRHLFGSYLNERLNEAQSTAASAVDFKLVRENVVDCLEEKEGVVVKTVSNSYLCDEVILCLGHVPKKGQPFPNNDHFIYDPWEFERFNVIGKDATVGILGSGLTAIDVILTLTESNPKRKLLCFARKRQLPKVKCVPKPVTLKHLTPDAFLKLSQNRSKPISLETLIGLMEKDFLEFPNGQKLWQEFFWDPPRDSVEAIAEALEKNPEDRVTWHAILDATSELIPHLWNQMTVTDRKEFRTVYEQKWHMFRHSMPEVNARKIYKFLQNGDLTVVTGGLKVDYDGEKKRFQVQVQNPLSPESRPETYFIDYLVDARGATTGNLDLVDSPLLDNMNRRGQISANPLGGVDVEFESSKILFRGGKKSERMAMVGELTRGVYFYTNSYEMNRGSAVTIVHEIVKKYGAGQ